MTTIAIGKLETALTAIEEKGDKFAALMPETIEFEYDALIAAAKCSDLDRNEILIKLLIEELIRRGYTVQRWYDHASFSYKFRATKNE